MLYGLTQGFYWLCLGAWFGAILMLVVAAATTFRTVREYQPALALEPYNHPELSDRAAPILAGAIVGRTIKGLAVVQAIFAAALAACVLLQCTLFADRVHGGVTGWGNLARVALIALPAIILVIDTTVVGPRIWQHRDAMHDPSQPPTARQDAKEHFDRLHKLNERMVALAGLSIVAAVFVSAFVFHGDGSNKNAQSQQTAMPLP